MSDKAQKKVKVVPVEAPQPREKKGTKNTQGKILKCTCEHPIQDKLYGQGMRMHNPKSGGFRCTVCDMTR